MPKDEDDERALLPQAIEDAHFPEKSHAARRTSDNWWRLSLEIFMGFIIIGLLLRPVRLGKNGQDWPIPKFPAKTQKFLPNQKYLHEDMFNSTEETLHTLHNWIELSADARGYVKIDDYEKYNLSAPYEQNINSTHTVPVFMLSVFHQLHCLSYLAEHYYSTYDATSNSSLEIAHHSAHCFDYLRQGILCAADDSLEGKTDAGPGWGSSHQCGDIDALREWANEHDVVKWRNGLLPGESVL